MVAQSFSIRWLFAFLVLFSSLNDPLVLAASPPSVTAISPQDKTQNIRRDTAVAAEVSLPNVGQGVDGGSLTSASVTLIRQTDAMPVQASLNTSGGGDVILLQPRTLLDPNTSYTFKITAGVKDTSGASFKEFSSTFTTGTQGGETDPSIAFEKIALPTTRGHAYTAVIKGPDGKLYCGDIQGAVVRFSILANGLLGDPEVVRSSPQADGAKRALVGMVFDPSATANHLVLWVTHSEFSTFLPNAPTPLDWTGKVTRLSGPNLENVHDAVVGLPRSIKDHLTNQPVFGPDKALYFAQGANNAMGAPDKGWGLRPERLLTAAILRIDVAALGETTLNVKTAEGGTYNPFAPGALLTIYATGVRNAYDLIFATNGQLYAPTNGSAANGNTPSGPGVAGISPVTQVEHDWLFRIEKGGYYGHPNPERKEFVLNGGNPDGGKNDSSVVKQYPLGTKADSNYRGFAADLGEHFSPNGVIEYQGNSFGGRLDKRLMITRYSAGKDILVVTVKADGSVDSTLSGVTGLTQFEDPLDLFQDSETGFVYVAEFAGKRLTLLRPIGPGAETKLSQDHLTFIAQQNGNADTGVATATFTITNDGSAALAIPASGLSIEGDAARDYSLSVDSPLPLTIAPGAKAQVTIRFKPSIFGLRKATIKLLTNADAKPLQIFLGGIGTHGFEGANEPSLQRLLTALGFVVKVGDKDPNTSTLELPLTTPNDEVTIQRFVRANNKQPVTLTPLAAFVSDAKPVVRTGFYGVDNPSQVHEIVSVRQGNNQSVNPAFDGTTTFEPPQVFGLFASFGFFDTAQGKRVVTSDDSLNVWEKEAPKRHKIRFYPATDWKGTPLANAFLGAVETVPGDGADFNDFVFLVSNVKAAP